MGLLDPPPFPLDTKAKRLFGNGQTPTVADKLWGRSQISVPYLDVVIGVPSPAVISGDSVGGPSTLRLDPNCVAAQNGVITSCTFYGAVAGTATIITLAKAGTRYTVKRSQAITIAVGLTTVPLSLDVDEGDVVAIHQGVGCLRQGFVDTAPAFAGNALYTLTSASVPTGTILPTGGPSGVSMQINYTVTYIP